jgi:hypothetical protein
VKYSSGTECSHCSIEIRSEGGTTKTSTDGNGYYSTSVRGCYVNIIWVNDKRAWEGTKDSCGGAAINLRAD